MKNILICNQKGGVGKSLIADELAFSFERSQIPMNFYDLDAQGGTLHRPTKVEDALVSVIDTPGALQEAMRDWIKAADVIVIPTRATTRDIAPLLRMKKIVETNNPAAQIVYVVNGWNRYKAASDFYAWVSGLAEGHAVETLPQSEKFTQAAANEESIVSFSKKGKVVDATLALVNQIRERSGFPAESFAI